MSAAASAASSGPAERPLQAGLQHPAHGRRDLRSATTVGSAGPHPVGLRRVRGTGRPRVAAGRPCPRCHHGPAVHGHPGTARLEAGRPAGWRRAAGWRSGWEYAWPRDSSWVAVALAETGHPAMAYRILRFLQRMQPGNGIWAARYLPGGAGPVRNGRPAELDADGWVPWAVWSWASTQQLGPGSRSRRDLAQLWPMVTRAADAAARSLTQAGLQGPAMDYWEVSVQVTLGTAAPLLAGLRAAADLAAGIGGATAASDGRRWSAAAARLAAAITATFGQTGYQHNPDPDRAPTRPSRSSGRHSPIRALRSCRRPGQHSRLSPSRTAACGPAQPGPARPASPGPRKPHSSRCSMPRPDSTARQRRCWTGSPPTGHSSVRCPNRSIPPASQPG